MPDTFDDPLMMRLERLERENRRSRPVGAVLLVGLAAVLLMGQVQSKGTAKVVVAERFVVRDMAGKDRAVLGTSPGQTGLVLFDAGGKQRAKLHLAEQGEFAGPALSLFDDQETPRTPRLLLTTTRHGPSVNIYDRTGASRADARRFHKPAILRHDRQD
jgi:hypothetical protein